MQNNWNKTFGGRPFLAFFTIALFFFLAINGTFAYEPGNLRGDGEVLTMLGAFCLILIVAIHFDLWAIGSLFGSASLALALKAMSKEISGFVMPFLGERRTDAIFYSHVDNLNWFQLTFTIFIAAFAALFAGRIWALILGEFRQAWLKGQPPSPPPGPRRIPTQ